jgi:hypothetical protein
MIAAALVVIGTLWYLRDPAWLAEQTTGVRGWQTSADGKRYRWTGGHASFFVPSDASAVVVPIATTFQPGDDKPMLVTFSVDGKRAVRLLLTTSEWQRVTLPMPAPGSRKVRRVDVHTSPTREGNHGVQLGEVQVSR